MSACVGVMTQVSWRDIRPCRQLQEILGKRPTASSMDSQSCVVPINSGPQDPSPKDFLDMNDQESQKDLIKFYGTVKDKAKDHYQVAEYYNAYSNISVWVRNLITVITTAVTTANVMTSESSSLPLISAVLAALLTVVTVWGTVVKPEERATEHFAASSR